VARLTPLLAWAGDQFGELPKILGCGCEVEFVAGPVRRPMGHAAAEDPSKLADFRRME
jgi:hypothetical protein